MKHSIDLFQMIHITLKRLNRPHQIKTHTADKIGMVYAVLHNANQIMKIIMAIQQPVNPFGNVFRYTANPGRNHR